MYGWALALEGKCLRRNANIYVWTPQIDSLGQQQAIRASGVLTTSNGTLGWI